MILQSPFFCVGICVEFVAWRSKHADAFTSRRTTFWKWRTISILYKCYTSPFLAFFRPLFLKHPPRSRRALWHINTHRPLINNSIDINIQPGILTFVISELSDVHNVALREVCANPLTYWAKPVNRLTTSYFWNIYGRLNNQKDCLFVLGNLWAVSDGVTAKSLFEIFILTHRPIT